GVGRGRADVVEEGGRQVVGREAALGGQSTGETVLVLQAEDSALHVGIRVTEGAAGGKESGAATSPRRGVGGAPRAGCGGTSGVPCRGRARPPRDRAP